MTWHPPTTMGDARDSAASPLTPDEEDDKAGVTAFGVSHYESTAKLHVKAPPVRPPVEFLLGAEPRDEDERLLLM